MNLFKRIGITLLLILIFIATARFCHHQTKGFRLSKLHNNLYGAHGEFGADYGSLNQPFYYFNRGLQSFVFLSEDGNYILKIFNNKYQHRLFLYQLLSHLPFCGSWAEKQAKIQHSKLQRVFQSYQIAATELKEQTALLYAHLEPTHTLPSALTLIDPLNIAHVIDPNPLGFVIQKKANMTYPELRELIQSGQLSVAKQRITSLIDLLLLRCQKGIADNDPLIRTNFGFIQGNAIEVDVGPFSKDGTRAEPKNYRPEILRITTSLKHWLDQHSPELVPFLEQQLEERVLLSHEWDEAALSINSVSDCLDWDSTSR